MFWSPGSLPQAVLQALWQHQPPQVGATLKPQQCLCHSDLNLPIQGHRQQRQEMIKQEKDIFFPGLLACGSESEQEES
jgi:hypothetical protein